MGTLPTAEQPTTAATVFNNNMSGEFPEIKSTHSLVAKHVTKERWDKLKDITTKTAGCTLKSCCECAIQFDNQHCGIYAGDWDCYKDFEKIKGNVNAEVPVHSTRVRVGRSIDGFGLS